ncbi:hypothetical protein ABH931_007468 [Streptacidiphilus sp. MAP12-33]|uniref:TolB family protein n=1 Tax=Streptacidiphilus sp. MAP12-33 TaxID=3156266 RepID=UPI0035152E06
MHAGHHRTSTALALAAAGTALLLTGCGAKSPARLAGGPASPSGSPSASAKAAPVSVVNGTGGNGLTISDGTNHVLMNGTSVDFGTAVRDLAWSPSGSKAVFVDGSGNLDVSNPDGSDRVTIAVNPGGQAWSHPTWVVTPIRPIGYYNPAGQNIFFADSIDGVSRVAFVSATGVDGKPTLDTPTDGKFGSSGGPYLPPTGNAWPSGRGRSTAFANAGTGEVYIRDSLLRTVTTALGQGSEPAMSPSGDEVVFVRSVAGVDHVFEQSVRPNSTATDLSFGFPQDATEPTWSPDGRTVAFRTPAGIDTVAIGGGAPVQVSTVTGLPAYRG